MTTSTQGPLSAGTEQAPATPAATGTTATASAGADKGQATQSNKGESGTSQAKAAPASTEAAATEVSFFDPSTIQDKPELVAAYKQMQAAYTKKTTALSQDRSKIEAYDAFTRDPMNQLKALASQYGLEINQVGARKQEQGPDGENWEPQNWQDVFKRAKEEVIQELMPQLRPVFDGVRQVTATNIEKQLDSLDPQWRLYEDEMKANMTEHPSLVKDVAKLYRLSVPEEVLNSRATQAAMKKFEDKAKSAQVHGNQGATKTAALPKKAANFTDAVEQARAMIANGGAA